MSLIRLLSAPFLLYLAYKGNEKVFFYWFVFCLMTDALDGFIARRFNMQTVFGAKLDSLADFAMYITGIYGLLVLKWDILHTYRYSFFFLIFYYVFIDLFALVKFKEVSSLHLISSKISGFIQAIFYLSIFTIGFYPVLYWVMFIISTLSFIENMYFLIKLKKMRSDLKSFFYTSL